MFYQQGRAVLFYAHFWLDIRRALDSPSDLTLFVDVVS